MTQFEFDQLTVLAGAWEISASTKETEAERKAYRRCANELRELLRYADTAPELEGCGVEVGNMRWPSDHPTLSDLEKP